NPARYQRRLANYRVFRERLIVPLVTVELAYGHDFELDGEDAEILIRLRGGDILWQKERLLNIALRALPDKYRNVVWFDCDVVFEADDWPERTSLLLDRYTLVQPFSRLYLMSADGLSGQGRARESKLRYSVPFLIATGIPAASCMAASAEQ